MKAVSLNGRLLVAVFILSVLLTGCATASDMKDPGTLNWLSWIQNNYDAPIPFFQYGGATELWNVFVAPLANIGILICLIGALSSTGADNKGRYMGFVVIMLAAGLLAVLPGVVQTLGTGMLANLDPPMTLRLAAQANNWPGHDGSLFDLKTLTEGDLNMSAALSAMIFTWNVLPAIFLWHFYLSLIFFVWGLYSAAFTGKIRWLAGGSIFLLANALGPYIFWGWFMMDKVNNGNANSIIQTLTLWNLQYVPKALLLCFVVLVVFPGFVLYLIPATTEIEWIDPLLRSALGVNRGDDRRSPIQRAKEDMKLSSTTSGVKGVKSADVPRDDPRAGGKSRSGPNKSGGGGSSSDRSVRPAQSTVKDHTARPMQADPRGRITIDAGTSASVESSAPLNGDEAWAGDNRPVAPVPGGANRRRIVMNGGENRTPETFEPDAGSRTPSVPAPAPTSPRRSDALPAKTISLGQRVVRAIFSRLRRQGA